MRRGSTLPPFPQRPRLRALGFVVAVGMSACRGSASQAPEPDANAWAQSDAPPPTSSDEPIEDEGNAVAARERPDNGIFRDEIRQVTDRGPAYLLRQFGPEPYRHDGHFVGWTVTRLLPDDPTLCAPTCDLAVGDVILQVNGNRLQTPQHLSDALAALPSWTALEVDSLRNGVRRRRVYPIVDAPFP